MSSTMKGMGIGTFMAAGTLMLAAESQAGITAAYTDTGGMSGWKDPFCQETEDGYAIQLDETWTHATPSIFSVEENSLSAVEGGIAGGAHLLIDKNVVNMTGFDFTGWIINITPNAGGTIKLVSAFSNRFDDITFTEFGDGSAQIVYALDGIDDTAVLFGETLKMEFVFQVNGALGFTIKQIPVPAPGALALLGAAGLVGWNRRRRS